MCLSVDMPDAFHPLESPPSRCELREIDRCSTPSGDIAIEHEGSDGYRYIEFISKKFGAIWLKSIALKVVLLAYIAHECGRKLTPRVLL
jgi:hypothetical protein